MNTASFVAIDWFIIIAYLVFALGVGFYFRKRASKNLSEFLLGGRSLPWYLAGMSMVATTFAADTPLWVTEKVAQHGISGNWLWWNMLIGGMLTTFFFAKNWRKAGVLTELEFLELRYGGKPAQWLRGIRSVYLGVFLNVIIIGWVNKAMIIILSVFFDIPSTQAFWLVMLLMAFVAVYSSLSGLLGIAITDSVQFVIAMTGSIALAYWVLHDPRIGGLTGLKDQLPAWRFHFFPEINSVSSGIGTFSITLSAFLSYFVIQWWASWYPGNEPGGGGYISQRMMSAKTEKDAVYASLFFQIAHHALRPWPWIIVALASLVLYPHLAVEQAANGYVQVMRDILPAGWKGLLFIAFLSAYMSTISTQLNWGAGYLANDLYGRFMLKTADSALRDKLLVRASKVGTVLLMLLAIPVTASIGTIDSAAQFLIGCGAGLGLVLILRWYWWRINAWSEIAATLIPILGMLAGKFFFEPHYGESWILANGTFYFTVGITTLGWLIVTFLTKPEPGAVLQSFYSRVEPKGRWKGMGHGAQNTFDFRLLEAWLYAVVFTYGCLFFMGYFLFGETLQWVLTLLVCLVSGGLLWRGFRQGRYDGL